MPVRILSNYLSRAGLFSGILIGLPPVIHFGSPELKARIIPEVLSGKKLLCLGCILLRQVPRSSPWTTSKYPSRTPSVPKTVACL
ncbi:hypothetical protein JVT61DRAFT_4550 [Boletus reticuloceps]|uniref:Uncharacterized protein n=1 Tax=Boletus reticuloceps TaxID=495285 RepID=A0A8I3A7E9_9AGAM|nr:hypothetical protein JVT61DRAFT_4550 [Boletus reticuloceps]